VTLVYIYLTERARLKRITSLWNDSRYGGYETDIFLMSGCATDVYVGRKVYRHMMSPGG
jgi:hypothetical protein